jgi:hypothetical protein
MISIRSATQIRVNAMARLLHEIWFDADGLPSCVLAGPRGKDTKRTFLAGGRCVATFEAGSHLEAMVYYNRYLGREPYTSPYPREDAAAYPEEWLNEQRTATEQ